MVHIDFEFMVILDQNQLGLNHNLDNQINIAHSLFNVILAIVRTREEIEMFWLAISLDLDLADAHD